MTVCRFGSHSIESRTPLPSASGAGARALFSLQPLTASPLMREESQKPQKPSAIRSKSPCKLAILELSPVSVAASRSLLEGGCLSHVENSAPEHRHRQRDTGDSIALVAIIIVVVSSVVSR